MSENCVVLLCRYLVNLGCIKPLCDLLTVMDSKIVQVALNGLENILRLGEQEAKQENNGTGVNPYCSLIEEAYGTAYKGLMGWTNPVLGGQIQVGFSVLLVTNSLKLGFLL